MRGLFLSLRPRHWVKNLFIFAAPFFSLKLFELSSLYNVAIGFVYWCMITSSMYLFNDILDRKEDILHPRKKTRPIASGQINLKTAGLFFVLLSILSIIFSLRLDVNFSKLIIAYFMINIIYSIYLKQVIILDVMCIASGFVLRVASGALLVNVGLSEWILMCTLLLALFLGFGKRQEEISSLGDNAVYHRRVLKDYDRGFLEHVPYVMVSSTIVCYILYTVSGEAVKKFGTKNLIYTTPFVIYGLLRYVYIAYEKNKGADPTQVLFQDLPTVINILLWLITVGLIIYIR
ncbi:MAG TPA: decaprenyl-phosphate phosphoribosyltransferase [Candidatus Omnitrophota bacterium]|nr:decaprenyl-phosphate phosphoribosyltransferase [Candidatus Omnitrophota bacterium]